MYCTATCITITCQQQVLLCLLHKHVNHMYIYLFPVGKHCTRWLSTRSTYTATFRGSPCKKIVSGPFVRLIKGTMSRDLSTKQFFAKLTGRGPWLASCTVFSIMASIFVWITTWSQTLTGGGGNRSYGSWYCILLFRTAYTVPHCCSLCSDRQYGHF